MSHLTWINFVSAYTVFTNAALDGICATLPSNEDDLLEVKGIGKKKLESYGDDILEIVRQYTDGEGGLLPDEGYSSSSNGNNNKSKKKSAVPRPPPITIESLTPEQQKAAEMAMDGKSVFISGAAGTGKSHVSNLMRARVDVHFRPRLWVPRVGVLLTLTP